MLWFKVLNNKTVLGFPTDALLAPGAVPGSAGLGMVQLFQIPSLHLLFSNTAPAFGIVSVIPVQVCHLFVPSLPPPVTWADPQ